MMGYGGYGGFGWMLGGGLMMLMMLLFWIGLIALVVWGVASLRGGQRPSAPDETPLESLRRRYASGEISREEFEQARRARV
jgi:putative membrane protein